MIARLGLKGNPGRASSGHASITLTQLLRFFTLKDEESLDTRTRGL